MKLKNSVKINQETGAVELRYLLKEYRIDSGDPKLLELFHNLQSGMERSEAEALVSAGLVEKIADFLDRENLLERDGDQDSNTFSAEWFLNTHASFSQFWLQKVYDHSLWELMVQGKATPDQVVGFALEKYHYIEAAHEHMAYAASSDHSEVLRPHLARHFVEEYTHGDIYCRGLQKLFTEESVRQSIPLPTTRALINYLNELALGNTFVYYAANEVLQMTENVDGDHDSNSVSLFNDAIRAHYPFAKPLVASFEAHTRLDGELDHGDAFRLMCLDIGRFTADEVCRALNAAKTITEYLVLYLDGIERYYAAPPHPIRFRNSVQSELALCDV